MLKRAFLLSAVLVLLLQASALGQERPPLAMRIEFEWTLIGVLGGAAVGALVWLTDPADPSSNLADTVAAGSAWGAIIGAGFGVTVLQRSANFPAQAMRRDPLHPENRISSDPVAEQSDERKPLALGSAPVTADLRFEVPLFRLHF